MREITLSSSLQNKAQLNDEINGDRAGYNAAIPLCAGGGGLCSLLGFLLFGAYALAGRTNELENYGGVALIVAAFVFFGLTAHFMDQSDDRSRRRKRIRIEKFKQDNSSK